MLKKKKPRIFLVSKKNNIRLKDVGKIILGNDENLTITSINNKNYEICKKDWGYYATPSINVRLKKIGFNNQEALKIMGLNWLNFYDKNFHG